MTEEETENREWAKAILQYLDIYSYADFELDYIATVIRSVRHKGKEEATKTMLAFIAKSGKGEP
jgi:hypothetical protein